VLQISNKNMKANFKKNFGSKAIRKAASINQIRMIHQVNKPKNKHDGQSQT
jgi:hypothetical protein